MHLVPSLNRGSFVRARVHTQRERDGVSYLEKWRPLKVWHVFHGGRGMWASLKAWIMERHQERNPKPDLGWKLLYGTELLRENCTVLNQLLV